MEENTTLSRPELTPVAPTNNGKTADPKAHAYRMMYELTADNLKVTESERLMLMTQRRIQAAVTPDQVEYLLSLDELAGVVLDLLAGKAPHPGISRDMPETVVIARIVAE